MNIDTIVCMKFLQNFERILIKNISIDGAKI